jgi:hypothetical protein
MPEIADAAQTPAVEDGGPVGSEGSGETLDSLVEKYFPEDETPAHAVPEDEAETHVGDEDTLEGHPESEEDYEDTEEEYEGDGEDTGEDEEEDTEEPLESDDADEDEEIDALLGSVEDEDAEDTPEEEFLPEFDRVKFLKDHPELEPAYKHFQSAFTKKMQEVSAQRKEMEAQVAEVETMKSHYSEFMDRLKGDETFEDFVVQAAIHRPEVMERAYERAMSLSEDEGEKKKYLREKEIEEREAKLSKDEQRKQAEAHRARVGEVVDLTQRAAKRLGLQGQGELEVAEQYVANKILQKRQATGKPDISNEEVVMEVKRAAKALKAERAKAEKAAEQRLRQKGLRDAQKRAKERKRPAPPKGGRSPGRKAPASEAKRDPRIDPMDAFIDQELGNDAGGLL